MKTDILLNSPQIDMNTANTSVPKLSNIQSFYEDGERKRNMEVESVKVVF